MCGINGIVLKLPQDVGGRLKKMNNAILHRGPDRQGVWQNEENTLGLSHVRLSILDLSDTGNQPMVSSSGRYVIVFNGEIYNYLSLKSDLDKEKFVNWRGKSDTEVLLESIEHWGLHQTVSKCIGMFAFGLYDKKERRLYLVRDRMGEKPLYYGWVKNNFVFSSDLDAITSLPEFDNKISRNSLGLYLQFSSVPEPYSIYENINKLKSGSILTFDIVKFEFSTENYWNLKELINKKNYSSAEEAINELDYLLRDSVFMQMQSDVSAGAFLSGGIDSSTIAAIMQSLSSNKIDTFCVGFHNKEYDEAEYARRVAQHIGTNHHELYVGDKELLDVVPKLSSIYSEPFSESSQIPTYLVSKLAKQKVNITLSGDAGDELFCGYWRYHFAKNLHQKLNKIPLPLRTTTYRFLSQIPYGLWKILLFPLSQRKGAYNAKLNYPDKVLKFLPLLNLTSDVELYHRGFMGGDLEVNKLLIDFEEPDTIFTQDSLDTDNYYDKMMYYDLMGYLPNNNLTKVERASMAISLENRVPLLDHRIVSFALSLPQEYKIHNNQDKWILKQVLYRYVPEDLFNRPKKGFSVPLSDWLRGSLKDWAAEILDEKTIKEAGFFNYEIINKYWQEHQSGKRNWSGKLWKLIIFQDWYNNKYKL